METLVWIIAGGLVGWASYAFLHFNAARGPVVSMIIGATGALVGAKAVAPWFLAATTPASDLGLPLMLFAGAVAFTFCALAQFLHHRWDL